MEMWKWQEKRRRREIKGEKRDKTVRGGGEEAESDKTATIKSHIFTMKQCKRRPPKNPSTKPFLF